MIHVASAKPTTRSTTYLLLLIIGLALALRVALWDNLPRTGMISDEAEYLAAADWLAQGRGFAWHQSWLWTRAPLYPLFLAAHIRLFGLNLTPIYLSQTLLSIVNVGLAYVLARQIAAPSNTDEAAEKPTGFGAKDVAPLLATALVAIYLPFAAYAQMLLSETLYLTLLMAAFLALSRWAERRRLRSLLAAGGLLGLATLTRGLTLGFLPLVALWVWLQAGGPASLRHGVAAAWQALRPVAALTAICATIILPWSFYASQTYGGLVLIDTTGAFNLLLGARTAYDGKRSDAPTRDFVLALMETGRTPDQRRALLSGASASCLLRQHDARLQAALARDPATISQGERQQLMTAEALCLLRETPGALAKSLGELIDFFQINYTGAERLTDGFTLGWSPRWWTGALFLLDDTLYVLALPLAVIGWGRRRHAVGADRRAAPLLALIGLWWAFNLPAASLLFAINRFRLPLLPFGFIVAAWAFAGRRAPRKAAGMLYAALALLLALVAITPYAYLQAAPSSWASYLGPYPSSLASSVLAWNTRPGYEREQQLMAALGAGDAAAARAILATGDAPPYAVAVAEPLLAGIEGRPQQGLELLADQSVAPLHAWQSAVVRGDLLRRLGDFDGARAAFNPTYVDDQNPVEWAWNWLDPPPLSDQRIDLGGDLDLGYIRGFYLGEGDSEARGDFRWSEPEAWLRFPAAGSGTPQRLCLRVDGRGWPNDLDMPRVVVTIDGATAGSFDLARAVDEVCLPLPTISAGADVIVHIRSAAFTPDAADLLARQGPQVGQLRRLGVRLDWAKIIADIR